MEQLKVSREVKRLSSAIQKEYKLTKFESLDLALKVEQNDLLRKAFVISNDDSKPTALEAIAISLGYK